MTDSPPKRASWQLKVALVAAGVVSLAAGSLMALEHVTRKERELVAVRHAQLRLKDLAARLEVRGNFPSVNAVVARLEVGDVSSATLAQQLGGPEFRNAALVSMRNDGSATSAETVVWGRYPHPELGGLFDDLAGLAIRKESSSWDELFKALGSVRGVDRRGVAVLSRRGPRVDGDVVHVPIVAGLYLASPSPVLLVLALEESEPVPRVLDFLQGKLKTHENE